MSNRKSYIYLFSLCVHVCVCVKVRKASSTVTVAFWANHLTLSSSKRPSKYWQWQCVQRVTGQSVTTWASSLFLVLCACLIWMKRLFFLVKNNKNKKTKEFIESPVFFPFIQKPFKIDKSELPSFYNTLMKWRSWGKVSHYWNLPQAKC